MSYSFEAELREDLGKRASRRMRRDAHIPAVIYGKGKEAVSITLAHDPILHAQENTDFYRKPLEIKLDGKKQTVKVQAIQRHHTKPKILHLDFLRV